MSREAIDQTSLERDLAATAALALFSFTVAVGFARVFAGWSFLVDSTVLLVIGHGLAFALRRARITGWIAVPGVLLLLLWTLLALRYAGTFEWALPSGETRELLDLHLGVVREQFQTAVAPVIYEDGWALLAGFAIVVTVVMADAFAFRADARGEALVPGGVLFVFIAALGSPRLRIAATALLIGAGILAVVALRSLHDRSRRVELTSRRTRSTLLPAAAATALVVALLAGVIGPRIPGAQADPLYETRGRNGGDSTLISPLVDIRSRLTNRGNVELFRVNADAAAYWRVTTLPEFDGRIFRAPREELERIDGDFGSSDGPTIRQRIQVLSLGGRLVPAAADPFQASGFASGREQGLDLNRQTTTLLAPDNMQAGDLFNIVSAAPALDPDLLRSRSVGSAPDPIFVELPDDLPSIVAETARAVTAGAASPYDQAIAMQDWFRNEFEYTLEVQSGHGTSAIENFLQDRKGYCEQFAATFAAMARTLGIPSRVAVGFTPGVLRDDGWYSVLGKNAHAWPELWFDGVGWVAFEPTPGRGAPGMSTYLGDVPPAQDESGQTGGPGGDGGGGDGGTETIPTTPSTVIAPPTTIGDGTPSSTLPDPGSGLIPNFPDDQGPNFGGELANGANDGAAEENAPFPWRWLVALGVVLLVALGPAGVRWWRRRSISVLEPTERVSIAWNRARDAAVSAGVGGTPAMTASEWADATASGLPVAARPMASLAAVVDRVRYSRPGSIDLETSGAYGSTLRHDCELWSHQVGRIARDQLTTRQRLRQYFFEF